MRARLGLAVLAIAARRSARPAVATSREHRPAARDLRRSGRRAWRLSREFDAPIASYAASVGLGDAAPAAFAARYLVEELGQPRPTLHGQRARRAIADASFKSTSKSSPHGAASRKICRCSKRTVRSGSAIALAYVDAFVKQSRSPTLARHRLEVVARFIALGGAAINVSSASTEALVTWPARHAPAASRIASLRWRSTSCSSASVASSKSARRAIALQEAASRGRGA